MVYDRQSKSSSWTPTPRKSSFFPPAHIQTKTEAKKGSELVGNLPSKAQRDKIRRSLFGDIPEMTGAKAETAPTEAKEVQNPTQVSEEAASGEIQAKAETGLSQSQGYGVPSREVRNKIRRSLFGNLEQTPVQKQEEGTSPPTPLLQGEGSQVEAGGEEKGLAETEISLPIQAKLTIGEPNDKYEQEADRVARQVVDKIHSPTPETVQREEMGDEDEVRLKSEAGSGDKVEAGVGVTGVRKSPIQRLTINRKVNSEGETQEASAQLEASIQGKRGSGQPLDESVKEPMEGAFGADFSGVRVHTDAQSDELNQAIQAKAFTTGEDIFFREGAYEPGSKGGQELLAHELTHVVQQSGGQHVIQLVHDGSVVKSRSGKSFVILDEDEKRYKIEGSIPTNLKENDKVKFEISNKGKAIIIPPDINVDDLNKEDLKTTEPPKDVPTELRSLPTSKPQETLGKDTTKEPLEEEKPQEDPRPPSSNDVEGTLEYVEAILIMIQSKRQKSQEDYPVLLELKNYLQQLIPTVLETQKEKESNQNEFDIIRFYLYRVEELKNILFPKKKDEKEKVEEETTSVNVEITQTMIDHYRLDVGEMGTWGGLAEADVAAKLMNIRCNIYRIRTDKTTGKKFYQLVHTIGEGDKNGNNWHLLHLGNHYEVISQVNDGEVVDQKKYSVAKTEVEGDCLYEALTIVRMNKKSTRDDFREKMKEYLKKLRKKVGKNLTDDMIKLSLEQILITENIPLGLGSNLKKDLSVVHSVKDIDDNWIKQQIQGLSALEKAENYYSASLELYNERKKNNPKALETYEALSQLVKDLTGAYEELEKQQGKEVGGSEKVGEIKGEGTESNPYRLSDVTIEITNYHAEDMKPGEHMRVKTPHFRGYVSDRNLNEVVQGFQEHRQGNTIPAGHKRDRWVIFPEVMESVQNTKLKNKNANDMSASSVRIDLETVHDRSKDRFGGTLMNTWQRVKFQPGNGQQGGWLMWTDPSSKEPTHYDLNILTKTIGRFLQPSESEDKRKGAWNPGGYLLVYPAKLKQPQLLTERTELGRKKKEEQDKAYRKKNTGQNPPVLERKIMDLTELRKQADDLVTPQKSEDKDSSENPKE